MRLVQDISGRWVGRPAFAAKVAGDRPPVALADAYVVEADGPTVILAVLDNDIDPDGGALSLVSAFAALGTAVVESDGTLRYTPPAGLTGFDSVVYEVSDGAGQTDTGQADITLVAPVLSVVATSDNRLEVEAATGLIDITVTEPAAFAGTYATDLLALTSGPVNLVKPKWSGSVAAGETLSAAPGLWIHNAAETPQRGWQWTKGGVSVPGATGGTLLLDAGDVGGAFEVIETLTTLSGSRSAGSGAANAPSFTPPDDPGLLAWYDASDAATVTAASGAVSALAAKSAGPVLTQPSAPYMPQTGSRSIGGLNAIAFTDYDRLTAPVTLPQGDSLAIHMAVSIDGVGSAFAAIVSMEATADFQLDANDAGGFQGRLNLTGVGDPVALSGGPFAGDRIISVLFDRAGAGTAEVWIDDVLRASGAMTAALDLNQTLAFFSNRSLNSSVHGLLGEAILTTSLDNRAICHAYLSSKWGIS